MGRAGSDEGLRVDLLRRSTRLTATVNELALDHLEGRVTRGFQHVGTGMTQIDATFEALEASARATQYNMTPIILLDPWDRAWELDRRSQDRGVAMQTLVSERTLTVNRLLSSLDPSVCVGHAVTQMIVIDRASVVLKGPLTAEGVTTAWLATAPEVLGPALELWDMAWADRRPAVAPGESPPFTRRQVQVALMMAQGHKDLSIARALGVSVRTVVSEVAQLAEKLQARSRVEAVVALRQGADRRRDGNPVPPGF